MPTLAFFERELLPLLDTEDLQHLGLEEFAGPFTAASSSCDGSDKSELVHDDSTAMEPAPTDDENASATGASAASSAFEVFASSDEEEFQPAAAKRLREPAGETMESAAASRGLTVMQFGKMMKMGTPLIFLNLLFYLHQFHPASNYERLRIIEFYSGVGRIAQQGRMRSWPSATFEWEADNVNQNAVSTEGYINMVHLAMRGLPQCLSHWATVCSSWVFVSRSSTGRCPCGGEIGWPNHLDVYFGNMMCCRMVIVLIYLLCVGKHYVVEQPATSTMFDTPWFVYLRRHCQWFLTRTHMAMFDGPTCKPTKLFSSSEFSTRMHRTLDPATRQRLKATGETLVSFAGLTTDGRAKVTGNKDLKGSQIYTHKYCRELVDEYEEFGMKEDIEHSAWTTRLDNCLLRPDVSPDWERWRAAVKNSKLTWGFARLNDVADFLNLAEDRPMRRF